MNRSVRSFCPASPICFADLSVLRSKSYLRESSSSSKARLDCRAFLGRAFNSSGESSIGSSFIVVCKNRIHAAAKRAAIAFDFMSAEGPQAAEFAPSDVCIFFTPRFAPAGAHGAVGSIPAGGLRDLSREGHARHINPQFLLGQAATLDSFLLPAGCAARACASRRKVP